MDVQDLDMLINESSIVVSHRLRVRIEVCFNFLGFRCLVTVLR